MQDFFVKDVMSHYNWRYSRYISNCLLISPWTCFNWPNIFILSNNWILATTMLYWPIDYVVYNNHNYIIRGTIKWKQSLISGNNFNINCLKITYCNIYSLYAVYFVFMAYIVILSMSENSFWCTDFIPCLFICGR